MIRVLGEEETKKVITVKATTASLASALVMAIDEGGWRHGVKLIDWGTLRDKPEVQIIRVRAGDRKMRILVHPEE